MGTAAGLRTRVAALVAPMVVRALPGNALARQILTRAARKRVAAAAVAPGGPVLVYQMGKVGSTAVYEALQRVCPEAVLHVHRLSPFNIAAFAAMRRRLGWRDPWPESFAQDATGAAVYEGIVRARRPAAIVCPIREPIGRNLSSYCQNLDLVWGRARSHELPFEQLVDGFLERFPHDVPLRWFDDELNAALGVDVYAVPFPHQAGSLRLDREAWRVLVYRADLPDAEKARQIGTLLGSGLTIERAHRTAEGARGDVYARLQRVPLPAAYVTRMLDSRYARHFFADGEREALFRRWTRS